LSAEGYSFGVGDVYSVVKFIVKVRLVENRANSTVGMVIVVNVIIQIRIPGSTLAIVNKACPSKPSHEPVPRFSERISTPENP
jgi:hypothetical protein